MQRWSARGVRMEGPFLILFRPRRRSPRGRPHALAALGLRGCRADRPGRRRHRQPRTTGARAAGRRRGRDRRRHAAAAAPPIRWPTCCDAKPACRSRAAAGRGRAAACSSAAPRRSSRWCWSTACVSARPRWAYAALESLSLAHRGAHRGAARARFQPLRRRRRGRRGADLHRARRPRCALRRSGAALGGYGSSEWSADWAVRPGRWTWRRRWPANAATASRRCAPAMPSATTTPTATATASTAGSCAWALTPAAGHRIGLTLLRTRLDSQYDGSEFLPPAYAQDASADFRRQMRHRGRAHSTGAGDLAAGWIGSARASRSVDDSVDGGRVDGRISAPRASRSRRSSPGRPASSGSWWWPSSTTTTGRSPTQLRRRRAPAQHRRRAGTHRSAGAWSWQADLRRDDSSDFGGVTTGRLGGGWRVAPDWRLRALAGTTFRAPSFNDLYYPGYGVATLQPERGRSIEAGVSWQDRGSEAAATVYRNRVQRAHRLRVRPQPLPERPGLRLRLCRQREARDAAGRHAWPRRSGPARWC